MNLKKLTIEIGKSISEHRRAKGLTSEKLAYETDISKGYLSDIENGKKLPSIKLLAALADTLDIEIKEFFN